MPKAKKEVALSKEAAAALMGAWSADNEQAIKGKKSTAAKKSATGKKATAKTKTTKK